MLSNVNHTTPYNTKGSINISEEGELDARLANNSTYSPLAPIPSIESFIELQSLSKQQQQQKSILKLDIPSVKKDKFNKLNVKVSEEPSHHIEIGSRERPYWDVVTSIVGIYHQSDGSGGREKDLSRTHKTITENDWEFLRRRGILSPSDPYRIAWEMFGGIFVFYTVLEVPFTIGFLFEDPPAVGRLVVEYFIVCVFFVDLAVNFCSAYVDTYSNMLIYDHRRIAEQYCIMWFWLDLLSTLPFEAMAAGSDHDNNLATLKIFRLVRLVRFTKILKLLQSDGFLRVLELMHVPRQMISVSKLMIKILLLGHIFGCFWFFMTTTAATGVVQPSCDMRVDPRCTTPVVYNTWSTEFGFEWMPVLDQYVAALYYTFATLLTVGYGDLHAVNVPERIFAVFMMLTGAMTFGAIIAEIRGIIESRNLLAREVNANVSHLKNFMAEKKVPTDLRLAALDAFVFSLENRPILSDEGLYDLVPDKTRLQILKQQWSREVALISILRRSPFPFTAMVLEALLPVMCEGGECIYESGDIADEMSFIYRGRVRLVQVDELRTNIKNSTVTIKNVVGMAQAGGFFGDFELVSHGTRIVRYEAIQSCKIYSVRYDKVRAAIEAHPAAGKRFMNELKRRRELCIGQLVSHKKFSENAAAARRASLSPRSATRSSPPQYARPPTPQLNPPTPPTRPLPLSPRTVREDLDSPFGAVMDDIPPPHGTAAPYLGTGTPSPLMSAPVVRMQPRHSSSSYNIRGEAPIVASSVDTTESEGVAGVTAGAAVGAGRQGGLDSLPTTLPPLAIPMQPRDHSPFLTPSAHPPLRPPLHPPHLTRVEGRSSRSESPQPVLLKQGSLHIMTDSFGVPISRGGVDVNLSDDMDDPLAKRRSQSNLVTTELPFSHSTQPCHSQSHHGPEQRPQVKRVNQDIIIFNPRLWVDGTLQDIRDEDKEEPRSNYEENLMPMVRMKNGKLTVVDDNITSLRKDFIFHPFGVIKIVWDSFVGLLIIYSITSLPMVIAFTSLEFSTAGNGMQIFDWTVDIIFFFDLLQNFNVAFYSEEFDADVVVRDEICKNYAKFWLWVDLVSCFPIDTVIGIALPDNNNSVTAVQLVKVIRLFRLAKLSKILNIRKRLDYLQAKTGVHPAFLSLLVTFLQVIGVAHVVCCLWWGLCDAITTNAWFDDPTIVYEPLRDRPFSEQYSTAIYWAITTLTATGYGDVVPINTSERIVATVAFIIGASMFGYVTANVAETVGAFTKGQLATDYAIYKINEYLQMFNVDSQLRIDVNDHCRHALKYRSVYNESIILARLPPHLRVALMTHVNIDVIRHIRIFDYIRNTSMRILILGVMRRQYAIPGRTICTEGK